MGGKAFSFGRNWQRFRSRYLTDDRIAEAEKSLREFLGTDSLRGKTFLDIGCGSGLFSLAAHRLGADRVVSLDVDPDSVECTRLLRKDFGEPASWTVTHGSVLDRPFLRSLGAFDVVYSWGVLHHTGAMWQAIENCLESAGPGGVAYVAIYNKTDRMGFHPDGRFGSSKFWAIEKRIYVALPRLLQRAIDWLAMGGMIALYLLTFQNPLRKIGEHRKLRGMSWAVDITDWLGGYPYECATAEEVTAFAEARGFRRVNLKAPGGLLNNEFLFRREAR